MRIRSMTTSEYYTLLDTWMLLGMYNQARAVLEDMIISQEIARSGKIAIIGEYHA